MIAQPAPEMLRTSIGFTVWLGVGGCAPENGANPSKSFQPKFAPLAAANGGVVDLIEAVLADVAGSRSAADRGL